MPKLVLLWLSASFLAGILTAGEVPRLIPWQYGLTLSAGLSLYAVLKKNPASGRSLFFALLIASFCLGSGRYYITEHTDSSDFLMQQSGGNTVSVQGKVVEPTLVSVDHGETIIQLENISSSDGQWLPAEGKLIVHLPPSFTFSYHTTLTLEGKLLTTVASDSKPHTSWLKRQGVDFQMYYPTLVSSSSAQTISFMGWLYSLKEKAYSVLQTILPFPESELLAGILLGLESRIPEYLQDAYHLTGTAHIIAISGFNISLIATMISKFFNRIFPYRVGAIFSIMTIALYTLLVGLQPAVVRAALMGIIAIPAYLIGRRIIGAHSLAISAACMALINPLILWDISFQLSFSATFGILMFTDYFAEKATGLIEKSQLPSKEFLAGYIKDFLLTALSAQIATFPVLIRYYENFSLISLLVNFLILPWQPAIMVVGGIALLAGLFSYPLGRILGWLAWFIAAFNDQIVLFFSQFPLSFTINQTIGFWGGIGLNLGLLIIVLRKSTRKSVVFTPGS